MWLNSFLITILIKIVTSKLISYCATTQMTNSEHKRDTVSQLSEWLTENICLNWFKTAICPYILALFIIVYFIYRIKQSMVTLKNHYQNYHLTRWTLRCVISLMMSLINLVSKPNLPQCQSAGRECLCVYLMYHWIKLTV